MFRERVFFFIAAFSHRFQSLSACVVCRLYVRCLNVKWMTLVHDTAATMQNIFFGESDWPLHFEFSRRSMFQHNVFLFFFFFFSFIVVFFVLLSQAPEWTTKWKTKYSKTYLHYEKIWTEPTKWMANNSSLFFFCLVVPVSGDLFRRRFLSNCDHLIFIRCLSLSLYHTLFRNMIFLSVIRR